MAGSTNALRYAETLLCGSHNSDNKMVLIKKLFNFGILRLQLHINHLIMNQDCSIPPSAPEHLELEHKDTCTVTKIHNYCPVLEKSLRLMFEPEGSLLGVS